METATLIYRTRRSFRKTEIKALLNERMRRDHPSFRFLAYATGVFHFQRAREFRDFDLKEGLHLVFSIDDNCMHASISSRLNPLHSLAPNYNNGFINPHVDLMSVKKNIDIFPSPETLYQHNGTTVGLTSMLDEMIADLSNYGIPHFDARFKDIRTNQLLNRGLDIIDEWEHDKIMLRNELQIQVKKAKLRISHLKHPLYNELKQELFRVPDQTPGAQLEIPRLAFELMELYCSHRIIT